MMREFIPVVAQDGINMLFQPYTKVQARLMWLLLEFVEFIHHAIIYGGATIMQVKIHQITCNKWDW